MLRNTPVKKKQLYWKILSNILSNFFTVKNDQTILSNNIKQKHWTASHKRKCKINSETKWKTKENNNLVTSLKSSETEGQFIKMSVVVEKKKKKHHGNNINN